MVKLKRNQLSTLKVNHAKPGVHQDGAGLSLWVKPSGGRSWVFRITIDGKVRQMGLGGYPSVGLRDAQTARAGATRRSVTRTGPSRPPKGHSRDRSTRLDGDTYARTGSRSGD